MEIELGYLGIEVPEARWPQLVEHCSFDWMKRNAERVAPLAGAIWEGGAATFVKQRL